MNIADNRITIRAWGDYACFTRPELKVERVSYPLCTPSAARGILEAIYWEPQMYYIIENIAVVRKGRWFTFRRNEVSRVININDARHKKVNYIEGGGGAKDAAQRNMLALKDVEYLITAEVRTTRRHDASRFNIRKYLSEIQRRASKGKCCHRPALGCREFAADFDWVEDPAKIYLAEWKEEDLGLMLYDVFDVEQRAEGFQWLAADQTKGGRKTEHEGTLIEPQASFFHAKIQDARMDCHPDRIHILWPGAKGGD
ncbi:type I-C CRISPR-associated protein Cas5c [Dehalococcoidia bacterium]|nr:type I-C CRISPR-associated protein Cas5c [Dehalococcoidia bacterium]